MDPIDRPYLHGAFAPVDRETTALDLPVHGTIPAELDGLFVRNGPNMLRRARRGEGNVPDFTGEGMLHGVRLRGGRAEWYRSRFIRSRSARRAAPGPRPPGPRHSLRDVVNTNVVAHGDLLLGLVEAGCTPVRLSSTLETVEYTDLGGTLPHGYSAHPRRDPVTGELHAIAYSPLLPFLEYIVLDGDARARTVQRIEVTGRPLVHDMALTPRFVLFLDSPVVFRIIGAITGQAPFAWDPRRANRIGVLPRDGGGAVRWFEVAPGFSFHLVNAYEDGEAIVLRTCRYERLFEPGQARPFDRSSVLWEYRVDLRSGSVAEEQLDDRDEDIPGIDGRLQGRDHRWAYTLAFPDPSGVREPGALLKRDLRDGSVSESDLGPATVPGEAVFVASGPGEDEGWLLSFVYDRTTDRSELVILDAPEFTAPPIARIRLPIRVPVGFHGSWVPDASLDAIDRALSR
ncbi:carotenoid cleavage dioxygenase [Allocatelliglobosispora scoriae]|uniref:Dioxygenase n=1 Tax=Allocatelliglobosispora scoriae TaxID=643052 RepID=A0A841BP54_9ACTN|nr:carotenoid oxygenase family protein [Allocatelliglobosispora scoriae]MBB5868733.1 carotenoid cleavage dioxygenase [Allocatelliglobosispora scoriae]